MCLLREQAGVNCKHLKLVSRVGVCDIVCLRLYDCWPCCICEHKSVTMLLPLRGRERQTSHESEPQILLTGSVTAALVVNEAGVSVSKIFL